MAGGTKTACLAVREACHGPAPRASSEFSLSATMALVIAIALVAAGFGVSGMQAGARAVQAGQLSRCTSCDAHGIHGPERVVVATSNTPRGANLTSVVVGPPFANISFNNSMTFVASPVCTTLLCPSGVTYVWNLTSSLFGSLNTNTGDTVKFTAGTTTGAVTLFVNATLNGTTKQSYPVGISINNGILPLAAYLYFDSSNSGYAPLTVTMTGNGTGGRAPYSLAWNTGDGGSATGVTVTHTYSNSGTFTVILTLTDSRGSSATASEVVVVLNSSSSGKTLQASITLDSSVIGSLPLNITMTASVSGGTSPYSYSWSFGDGSSGKGIVISHEYTSAPSGCNQTRCGYTVNLTATDSVGNVASSTTQVTVLLNATPEFSVYMTDTPASGVAPLIVSFHANASGGNSPYSYAWAYGDSSTGTGASGQHTFANPGTFTVVLTGVDADGAVAQVTSTVLAYPPPSGNVTGAIELAIVADPVTGPAPLTTFFSASASGGTAPYTFNWSFGDNNSVATGVSVSHTYTAPGSYVTTIVTRDSAGNTATTGVFVTVTKGTNAPNQLAVIVTALKLRGNAPLTITFVPAVIGGSAPYQLTWGFGDGAFAVVNGTVSVTHTYSKPGTYTPTLQVMDAIGSVSNWSEMVSGISQSPGNGGQSQLFTSIDWTIVISVVVAITLILVAVGIVRKRDRPPSASRAEGSDSFVQVTPEEILPEPVDPEEDYGPPRPSPNNDPLYDVFAGLDAGAAGRAARSIYNVVTW